jgi:hypothetical protein
MEPGPYDRASSYRERARLGRGRDSARSDECLRELREHQEVSVKLNTLKPTDGVLVRIPAATGDHPSLSPRTFRRVLESKRPIAHVAQERNGPKPPGYRPHQTNTQIAR